VNDHGSSIARWLVESHLTRRLFPGMLAKIAMLPPPAG
jgi:hypothetical protein